MSSGGKVKNTTPSYIKQGGKWAAGQLQGAIGGMKVAAPYANMENPYEEFSNARYNGLFGNDGGQTYLNNYMAAPKAAFDEGLAAVKNIYGANGLYGSVGGGLMSSALGDVTSNYATAMAQAQNQAAQQYNQDWGLAQQAMQLRTQPQQWENQNRADSANFQSAQNQAYTNALLGMYGGSVGPIMQGQTVSGGTDWGSGVGALLGGAMSMAGNIWSSEEYKTNIEDAGSALDMIDRLAIKNWEYKPGNKAVMDPDGEAGGQHIGPMAENWKAVTGIGTGKSIPSQDVLGLALKAIQELRAEMGRK